MVAEQTVYVFNHQNNIGIIFSWVKYDLQKKKYFFNSELNN